MTAVEFLREIARRLTPLTDPVDDAALKSVLASLPKPAGLSVRADDGRIIVDLPGFGLPADPAAFAAAETVVHQMARQLGLPEGGGFDRDERDLSPARARLRAGYWAVVLAVVSDGDDVPVIVEVSFAYGADLTKRLAELAGPPLGHAPVDWDALTARIGVELPEDYRWLMNQYGTVPISAAFILFEPVTLRRPIAGPMFPLGDYHQLLPVGATPDGDEIAYILDWEISGLRIGGRRYETGLLHHLVVTLAGRHLVGQSLR
ncbi:SMI1/KNR4 family protein [Actinoplanes derwentensis]|uniref:Uncharacterized protein n=1 Tax=Actinoplanes derwentensis TaxID=113562 RepID=A0A1H2B2W8_9ACTN|nr:SMI1/KNR4 family protein [Actinoplanes derwentensis]GID87564.1 hypothetical protein Ade03nite_64880 [Actinoplanes derwentensis]SDT52524.1 hypothetical protein SAMN04489716_4294 [Actinoplanes derwentensis]